MTTPQDPYSPGGGQRPVYGPDETLSSGYDGGYDGPDEPGFSGAPVGAPEPSRRSRARWIAVGIGAVAVAALAAGTAFAINALRGGGPQPEEFLPADSVAFVKVDLDPSAGQKVGAVRFLRKFPEVRDEFSEDRDLRESVFEFLTDAGAFKDVDYATEVEPWLGDRVGVGVLPSKSKGSEPTVVIALQVKDEAKARAGIRRVVELGSDEPGGDEPPGVVVRDGYAIIAESQEQADQASAAAAERSLSDDAEFAADFDRLGETGVNAGWVDLDATRELAEDAGAAEGPEAAALDSLTGRLSYAVRFDGDDLEVAGDAVGLSGIPKGGGETTARMGDLPTSTVAALGLADGDAYVHESWQRVVDALKATDEGADIQSAIDDFEQDYDLSLPADLAVLFGKSLTVGVDSEGLAAEPQIGARAVTDGDQAMQVVKTLERALRDQGQDQGQLAALSRVRTDDGLVVATTDAYADALAKDGGLGDSAGFQTAVPDVEGADFAMYVDVDRIADVFSEQVTDSTTRGALAAVDAFGITAVSEDEGSAKYRIRVVTR